MAVMLKMAVTAQVRCRTETAFIGPTYPSITYFIVSGVGGSDNGGFEVFVRGLTLLRSGEAVCVWPRSCRHTTTIRKIWQL